MNNHLHICIPTAHLYQQYYVDCHYFHAIWGQLFWQIFSEILKLFNVIFMVSLLKLARFESCSHGTTKTGGSAYGISFQWKISHVLVTDLFLQFSELWKISHVLVTDWQIFWSCNLGYNLVFGVKTSFWKYFKIFLKMGNRSNVILGWKSDWNIWGTWDFMAIFQNSWNILTFQSSNKKSRFI